MQFGCAVSLLLAVASAHTTNSIVEQLNVAFASYNPADPTSNPGIAYHATSRGTGLMDNLWDAHCGNCTNREISDCGVSTSYLNHAVSAWDDDWVSKATFGMTGTALCIYPGGLIAGGVIFSPQAVEASLKCAYAVDAYSELRPNRGCGCGVSIDPFEENCVKSRLWNCPKGNACMNQDPVSGGKITANSTVLTACQCTSVHQNPSGNENGDAACLWEGPQLFNGSGHNDLRQALMQQHPFRKTNPKCWNEIVLDQEVLTEFVRRDPAAAIIAFALPLPFCLHIDECQSKVFDTRDFITRNFKLEHPIPVVGFDLFNATAPFRVLDGAVPSGGIVSGHAVSPSVETDAVNLVI